MSTKNCATNLQVEIITSPVHVIYAFFQLILLAGTFIGSIFATKELFRCSILPNSTRILLSGALFFVNVHEFAYFHMSITVFQRNFFHSDPSCYPLHPGENCTTILTFLALAICGNMCIQCALCLDRLLATLIPLYYSHLQAVPGVVLLLIVLTLSSFCFEILRSNYCFDDTQFYCVMWPQKMAARANTFLEISLYLIISNIVLNVLIIRWNKCQEMKHRFHLTERYQTVETLKTTVVICRLSIFQFLSILMYSGGILLMRRNIDRIPAVPYMNTVIWLYAQPYACVSLPFLVVYSIRKLKKQRTAKIDVIVHQTESQDDHIAKLRQTWS